MKTPVVIGVVAALHCVAVGTLLLTGGCGTTRGTSGNPVQFQEKTAVVPKARTPDVMPEKVAAPRVKPIEKDEEEDIFSMPPRSTYKPPAEPKEIKEVKASKPAKPAAVAKTYKIKSGDSLGYIAQRFKVSVAEIKELNPSIKDVAKIREGQTLKLPSYVDLSAPAPKRRSKPKAIAPVAPVQPIEAPAGLSAFGPTAPAAAPVAAGEYVIVSGDYPEKIAKKLGVKMSDLIAINKITDPKKLKIGQKLVVPGLAAAAPAFPMGPVEAAPLAPVTGFDSTSAVPGMLPAAPAAPVAPGLLPAAPAAPVAPAMGPAPVSPVAPAIGPAPAVPGAAAGARPMNKHLVAPGETLKDIAMLYTVTVADIMRANNMTSEAVAPGQQLNIPPAQ
jgi:LysM repeat protein